MHYRYPAAALVILLSSVAHAQPVETPEPNAPPSAAFEPPPDGGVTDAAVAEALFREGRRLMKQRRYTEACEKLAESNGIEWALGTQLYLALCYEQNGQTASAWVAYHTGQTVARERGETERARRAAEHADALEPKLSRLTIIVPAGARGEGLQIHRNDVALKEAMFGVAVPVDPGQHVIRATAPDRKPWSTTIRVGASRDRVVVEVPPLESDATIPDLLVFDGAGREQADAPSSPYVVAGLVITGALTAASIVSGAVTLSKYGEFQDINDGADYARAAKAADSTRRWATATTVLVGGAVAAGIGTAALYYVGGQQQSAGVVAIGRW